MSSSLYNSVLLLAPAALWVFLFVAYEYSARTLSGAFLAFAWQFQSALFFNVTIGDRFFWHFSAADYAFYGVPIGFLIGQNIFCGPVNFILFKNRGAFFQIFLASGFLIVSYAGVSAQTSYETWPLGMAILIAISVAPGLLLAKWTDRDDHIYMRSCLQTVCWVFLLLWFFPSIVLINTGRDWNFLFERSPFQHILYLTPVLLPALILCSALYQFAVAGGGTAFPYDPPKKLVVTGVYAYVSNPMQIGICLLMAWWGVVLESIFVSLSALVALFLFAVFKNVCNGSCAIGAHDPNWRLYQQAVPRWIPRKTPFRLDCDKKQIYSHAP